MERLICCANTSAFRRDRGLLPFLRHFSNEDIRKATGGFGRIVSKNSLGSVYKAHFQDGFVATVKEVNAFHQEKDAFYGYVDVLGRLHHRHIISLRGFSAGPERFLVFEYAENGSLKDYLRDPLKSPLNWRTRLLIAVGVASALEYLHFFCEPPVYHVSITSSNILLDENFVPKLSEISLLGSIESQSPLSHDSHSRDYISREHRNPIFQLGLLILELITGQSPGKEGTDLVQWVQGSSNTHVVHKMIDPDLGNNYDSKELKDLLTLAKLCTKRGAKPTFSIQQILRYLQMKVEPLMPVVPHM
ncbi:hypothetical protein Scep_003478 [Stephania cephalantha]|uniref:Protein kinase domain-containing protein n=1 Tax=Stephania cephalantha TaxID=152367 RepID=A0AAP0KS69_9MAGN